MKVHCCRQGGQTRHQADPEGLQGEGRIQARGNGQVESRGVSDGGNLGEENVDITGGRRGGGGGGSRG